MSRRRHLYKQSPQLEVEIAHSIRTHSAVLGGEIVCLGADGRSLFNRLLFRRDWRHFVAFDVLSIDGEDLPPRPLLERKRRLRALMPRIESRLVYMDHVVGRRSALFAAVCEDDLEGIVAKWTRGQYRGDRMTTSWLKIRNTAYSRMHGRPELFGTRRPGTPSNGAKPVLSGTPGTSQTVKGLSRANGASSEQYTPRKSSIFLRRIVCVTFMRVNARCASLFNACVERNR